ncbi:hypothetical protein [Undibacterium sp. Di24W]|uniref:hypothetical protein n=1 Tax=Undibacterium sp. Di24W TaxID=3413033 RepID=UPI003BF1639D
MNPIVQIRRTSLEQLLVITQDPPAGQSSLLRASDNARVIVAALTGILANDEPELSKALASRIGLSADQIDHPLLKVPA